MDDYVLRRKADDKERGAKRLITFFDNQKCSKINTLRAIFSPVFIFFVQSVEKWHFSCF
jgi:hypothetical protein